MSGTWNFLQNPDSLKFALDIAGHSRLSRFWGFPLSTFRFFIRRVSKVTHLLLYLDTSSLPFYLKRGTLQNLLSSLTDIIDEHLKCQLEKPEVGNTLEFAPLDEPEGFKLKLYDYQKRSLQWMRQVENCT